MKYKAGEKIDKYTPVFIGIDSKIYKAVPNKIGCYRCGISKKELRRGGYSGCKVYGTYYGRHKFK